jgi:Zn-dependent protease with chaperone function
MPTYPGLSSDAFRHPLDLEAEQTLRSVPGFDVVTRKFIEFFYERPQMIHLMGNAIQVSPYQYSSLHQIFRECVACLDVHPQPQLFVVQNPVANSYALGEDNPYIVINSGLLDLLDPPELQVAIAHELGHIKCGHSTLTQMAIWTMNAAAIVGEMTLGVGSFISNSLVVAFYEWRRKAELSADRASLLATDDLSLVFKTMMKLAGGSQRYSHELNVAAFQRQSQAYQQLDQDGLNAFYKVLFQTGDQGLMLTHPFPVERVSYLQEWADSAAYQALRSGYYTPSNAPPAAASSGEPPEVVQLRQQIADLQAQIDRHKKRS